MPTRGEHDAGDIRTEDTTTDRGGTPPNGRCPYRRLRRYAPGRVCDAGDTCDHYPVRGRRSLVAVILDFSQYYRENIGVVTTCKAGLRAIYDSQTPTNAPDGGRPPEAVTRMAASPDDTLGRANLSWVGSSTVEHYRMDNDAGATPARPTVRSRLYPNPITSDNAPGGRDAPLCKDVCTGTGLNTIPSGSPAPRARRRMSTL